MRRTSFDWLVVSLLKNTDWYSRQYIDQKLYRLKARLNQLLDMSPYDISSGSGDIQTEEHIHFFRAAHRYVIALLETYDYEMVKQTYDNHCEQCSVYDNLNFGRVPYGRLPRF
jgi:hypothetical protein